MRPCLKRIFFAAVFSLPFFAALAGDTLWFVRQRDIEGKFKHGNLILAELANDNGILARKFKIAFPLNLQTRVDSASGQVLTTIRIGNASGLTNYLGYNMAGYIVPRGFTASIHDGGSGEVVRTIEVETGDSSVAVFSWTATFQPAGFYYTFDAPRYSDRQWEDFRQAQYQVRDYFALCEAASDVLRQLKQFFATKQEDIPGAWILFFESRRVRVLLDEFLGGNNLPLDIRDPCSLKATLAQTDVELYRLRLFLERNQEAGIGRDTNPADIAAKMLDKHVYWLMHSGFLNPFFNKVFTEIALLKWKPESFADVRKVFGTTMANSGTDDPESYLRLVAGRLSEKSFETYEQWMTLGRYAQAAILLENALTLADASGADDLYDLYKSQRIRPAMGIFNAYLTVALDAIKRGNLKISGDYLEKALNYQKENTYLTGSSFKAKEVYESFADACLDKAMEHQARGRSDEALPFVGKAKEYAARLSVYARFAELSRTRKDVLQSLYNQKITSALSMLKAGNYPGGKLGIDEALALRNIDAVSVVPIPAEDSAMRMYDKAGIYLNLIRLRDSVALYSGDSALMAGSRYLSEILLKNYQTDTGICHLLMGTGRVLVDRLLTETGSFLWDYRIQDARRSFRMADSVAVAWLLGDCEWMNYRLDDFRTRISKQECYYARYRFDNLSYRARTAFEARNYTEGARAATAALAIQSPGDTCRLQHWVMDSLLKVYRGQIKFSFLSAQIDQQTALARPDSAEYYRSLLFSAFIEYAACRSEFARPDTVWLLNRKPQAFLTDFYFSALAGAGSWQQALKLLEDLRMSGFTAETTTRWQQAAARAIAATDGVKRNKEIATVYLDQAFPDRLWYAPLRDEYLKAKLGLLRFL